MHNISKYCYSERNVWVIGISDLDIIWNLELVIWDLRSRETNYLCPD